MKIKTSSTSKSKVAKIALTLAVAALLGFVALTASDYNNLKDATLLSDFND